jgi:hypothetical protein
MQGKVLGFMPQGKFRDGPFAHVAYDVNVTVPISKALYRMRGYRPPFEELPTGNEPVRGTADLADT